MSNNRVVMGVVTGAHGVRGDVRIKSFTDEASDLTAYGPLFDTAGKTEFKITLKGESKGLLLARIDGVSDRNAAEAMRGTELTLDRDLLPEADEEEFYHADLLGLDAVDRDGVLIGTVRGVHDFGSGDVLDIVSADGVSEFFEFSRDVVPDVDLANGQLTIVRPDVLEEERNS